MTTTPTPSAILELRDTLLKLRQKMLAHNKHFDMRGCHAQFQLSAVNFVHYLAMRSQDLRNEQQLLAALGLSSLGRAEAHTLANLDAVLSLLHQLTGDTAIPQTPAEVTRITGRNLLNSHTDALLGAAPPTRQVRIMVTMPSEAADDASLIKKLLLQGMDCMRINCAHDSPPVWQRMIDRLHRAQVETGRSCRILMDLAGPKLRTGPITPGPAVQKISPDRDALGRVVRPARLWLGATASIAPSKTDATLVISQTLIDCCHIGDSLEVKDARGAHRYLQVTGKQANGLLVDTEKTIYFTENTRVQHMHQESSIGGIEAKPGALKLLPGDTLLLTRDAIPGRPAKFDNDGTLISPAQISCTLPDIFDDLTVGQPIWFDDGKLGGRIEALEPRAASIRIEHAPSQGAKLRADKGINLPETHLRLPALTHKDREDLAFVVQHADMVALSFANRAEDVLELQSAIAEFCAQAITPTPPLTGIVIKIETRRALQNLPAMLLTAMRSPCCGVMIARGDLAVECGFERLAEVQEEILWLCEAAHIPVIWATQVLETLAKTGFPSRAEITDAAMSHRAECVMLNKGPHVLEAVKTLDDILRRMQQHQQKKSAMLRALQMAGVFKPLDSNGIKIPTETPIAQAPHPPLDLPESSN